MHSSSPLEFREKAKILVRISIHSTELWLLLSPSMSGPREEIKLHYLKDLTQKNCNHKSRIKFKRLSLSLKSQELVRLHHNLFKKQLKLLLLLNQMLKFQLWKKMWASRRALFRVTNKPSKICKRSWRLLKQVALQLLHKMDLHNLRSHSSVTLTSGDKHSQLDTCSGTWTSSTTR